MSTKIFVNLPVKDLGRSTEFFTKLGFPVEERFTDEKMSWPAGRSSRAGRP
jgi:uncharacterized protein